MSTVNPRSVRSARSVGSRRLRPSGGYRDLRFFHVATIIYDATVQFCQRFLDPRSRLVDQMTQAARGGRQSIASGNCTDSTPGNCTEPSQRNGTDPTQGSRASATSSQTELRLINVARASLNELLLAYEDFLRQRNLRQWAKDSPEAQAVRSIGTRHSFDQSAPSDYSHWLTSTAPGAVANCLICLIHQANYRLDQQIRALEKAFIHDGGYTEQLATARIAERHRQSTITPDPSAPPDPSDSPPQASGPIPGAPSCPKCGKPMSLRTARKGLRPGSQFWGCSQYPACKAIRNLE